MATAAFAVVLRTALHAAGRSIVIASQDMVASLICAVLAFLAETGSTPAPDFEFFKQRVQPIFLQKRTGHARCITCHEHGSPPIEPLAAGASNWTEEQSRKNFAVWKQFVRPGDPLHSKMLLHPLLHSAGGDVFHAGGKHWKSQNEPEWQTLAAWVRGEKLEQSRPLVLQSNS